MTPLEDIYNKYEEDYVNIQTGSGRSVKTTMVYVEPEGGRSMESEHSTTLMKDEDDWERRVKVDAETGQKIVYVKMLRQSEHFIRMKTPNLFHNTQDLLIMGYEPLLYSDRKRCKFLYFFIQTNNPRSGDDCQLCL
jgi:hypothetical protein